MKYLALFLLPSLIFASPTVIESDDAVYNGKSMILNGNVSLKHDYGTLSAQKADLSEPMKDFEFRYLHLQDKVTLSLKDSTLNCARFDLDTKLGIGELFGEDEPILLSGMFQNKSLNMTCPEIELTFNTIGKELELMKAKDKVQASYSTQFKLNADSALFKQKEQCLTFLPPCALTSLGKTEVEGSQIDLFLDKKEICFQKPKGQIFPPASNEKALYFSGDLMSWKEDSGILRLNSNIKMTFETARLKNSDEVRLILKDKRTLQTIESVGPTTLSCDGGITLFCMGKTEVDMEKRQVTLNATSKTNQVQYTDPTGNLKADEMILYYSQEEGKLVPNKITFKGNVSALNNASFDKQETGCIERFAVADFVTYIPADKEITLKALPGKKVLFFDKIKNIQISADEIIADKRETEHIKTKGHVRMVFNEKEVHQIKERFSINE